MPPATVRWAECGRLSARGLLEPRPDNNRRQDTTLVRNSGLLLTGRKHIGRRADPLPVTRRVLASLEFLENQGSAVMDTTRTATVTGVRCTPNPTGTAAPPYGNAACPARNMRAITGIFLAAGPYAVTQYGGFQSVAKA